MVDKNLYEIFKQWWAETYPDTSPPKNSELLRNNTEFLKFTREELSPEERMSLLAPGLTRPRTEQDIGFSGSGTTPFAPPLTVPAMEEIAPDPQQAHWAALAQSVSGTPTASAGGMKMEVREMGGHKILVQTMSDGSEAYIADLGPVAEEGLTPWQESQLSESRAQRQLEADQIGLTRARQEAQAWQQRFGAGGTQEEVTPPEELARQWDMAQKQALSVYSQQPDVNWIQIGQERLKQNPWGNQATDRTPEEDFKLAEEEYKIAKNQRKSLQDMLKDPQNQAASFAGEYGSAFEDAKNKEQHWSGRMVELYDKVHSPEFQQRAMEDRAFAEKYGAAPPPAVPTGVATPAWLQSRAYGGATAKPVGSQIPGTGTLGGTPQKLATPSAQQWRGMTLGEQRQWGGYAKFAGQDPEQLLRQTEQMLPQKLSLGRAWQSARQF